MRRPANAKKFNGRVLVEWQNVTAGYDLDALWNYRDILREGYAWVGVSAQRVGVDQLRGWSPARYGDLDVTGAGQFTTDQLSYDIFSQAAQAIRSPQGTKLLGGLKAKTILAIGASQSAGRMVVYYDRVLPQIQPVFDGYGFIVGGAPTRVGKEPVFQVLSETDVRTPDRRADSNVFRRWEVAGSAHSGWDGQEYRGPLSERDLGGVTQYNCDRQPFSRMPIHQVTGTAYDHLARWAERGTPPPAAPVIQFNADGTKARDENGFVKGGIRLSQLTVPTALNDGDNSGESFCRLFGSYTPYDQATLKKLYPSKGRYVAAVVATDLRNIRAGYITPADAALNLKDALAADLGK
ncbi:hypothetical protein DPM19_20985 [Actinomadura craniellae]|uniref:Alpha/beta hydrolase domain-containing protein n=1 Tax=Actinomadura craniellae TaxID=2231787 RepID=A0A365H2A8_9ACTN|nr:hypothetical protein DPM19_20985 [Actinomadura craniellae]